MRVLSRQFGRCLIAAMLPVCAQSISHATDATDEPAFFESRIRPLLIEQCYDCHGPDEASGGLRLDLKSGWERGGDGGPAVVPGDPLASLLIRAVSYENSDLQMPPPDAGDKLSDVQIADLVAWVRHGAVDPRTGEFVETEIDQAAREHWAFQPVRDTRIPEGEHPVDFFIDRVLRDERFEAVEEAHMETLVRRATYDLHGLPPTASQLVLERDEFPQFVEQLLSSPHYGERWGRHWLDVARYSDAKDGVLMYGDARVRPFAYTYRDYVIRAFNEDKPFDEFARQQLAADQLGLSGDSPDLAAMGFLTLGRMFDNNRHDVIDDQIDVITRGFLGLTVGCSRCHDHKFDPVPTADYYSLYGVLASSVEPLDRPRIGAVGSEGQAFEDEFAAKLKEVEQQRQAHYDSILKTALARTADYLIQVATTEPSIDETSIFFLSLLPDQLRPRITWRWRQLIARRAYPDDQVFGPWHDLMKEPVLRPEVWKANDVDPRIIAALQEAKPSTPTDVARVYGETIYAAWAADSELDESIEDVDTESSSTGTGSRSRVDDPLAALLVGQDSPVWFPKDDVYHYLSRQAKDAYGGLVNQLDAISVKHKSAADRAMVLVDSEVLCEPVIFHRGDPGQRGAPVPRRFLSALTEAEAPPFPDGSGRLNLADAIVSPSNPLTARVWVNRVWMHHFGEPLVESPSDFGLRTSPPKHLELLDYLAAFLIREDWKTKPLHRLIMTSRAWQRSSTIPETDLMTQQLERDPSNRLIWHANRRRLDLEQMRDTVLMLSGRLDTVMYGRPAAITDSANTRRTIYSFVERQNIPSIVQTFDFASADTSTARRVTTTVPQQALFAMNSEFMALAAQSLAEQVSNQLERAVVVDHLFQAIYGRTSSEEENRMAAELAGSGFAERLAHVLLMSNELMFVD